MSSEKDTLVDVVFPKEPPGREKSNKRPRLKTLARISPFVALLAVIIIMWGFGPIGIIIGLLCGGSLIGIMITSVVMKKNGRDPSALLAAAAFKPLMILLGLCVFIGALIYFGRPEYISIQKDYKKNHPGKPFPKDEFFGFILGETSLEEAIEVFKAENIAYKLEPFEGTDILSLSSSEYTNSQIPFKKLFLEFDENKKIYSIKAFIDNRSLKEESLFSIHRAFNRKFKRKGDKPFNEQKMHFYWTNRGATIVFNPSRRLPSISIENSPKEKQFESFRDKAKLVSAQNAVDKIFPKT